MLERALALDPSEGIGWAGLAALGWWNRDNVGCAVAARRGIQVTPNEFENTLTMALCFRRLDLIDEAIQWAEQALTLDPDQLLVLQQMAILSTLKGDYAGARFWIDRMRQAGGFVLSAADALFMLELVEGNLEAAARALSEVVRVSPNASDNGSSSAQVLLAWTLAQSGDAEGYERLADLQERRLEQVQAGSTSERILSDLNVIASVLGTPDEQLDWFLQATAVDRDRSQYFYRHHPWLDPIRELPGFREWLAREEEEIAGQVRELDALGPWTPEAVLGAR